MTMKKTEPPSRGSKPHLFLVGKDSHGHWVAQDQSGLRGGLFVDQHEAVKFALFENGHQPQSVVMVPGTLELDLTGRSVDRRPDLSHAFTGLRAA
jgi:hypothetical protein